MYEQKPVDAVLNHSSGLSTGLSSRPSINLRLFWFACLAAIITSHYSIASGPRLPWLYRVAAVMIVLLVPLTAGFGALVQQTPVILLIAFEVVLVTGSLVGFSGSPGDFLTTNSEPVTWLRCFPMLLCGFTLARYPNSERRWILWLTGIFALLTIPDVAEFLRGNVAGTARVDVFMDTNRGERQLGIVNSYVNLSPACLFLALLALRPRDVLHGFRRWLLVAIQLPLLLVPLVSGYTAPAVLFFTAAASAVFVVPVRNLAYRLQAAALTIVAIVAIWVALVSAGTTLGGSVGQVARRLESLRQAIANREITTETNVASSGRLELSKISWNSFINHPVFGAGGASDNSETQGGHSFFLDTLARFGVIGSFPMFAAFVWLTRAALHAWRRKTFRWSGAAMVLFMASWIVALFINPYFLGYITLNYVVFLSFGFIIGDSVYRRNSPPQRQSRDMPRVQAALFSDLAAAGPPNATTGGRP
jgi:hypothetical protein